MFTIYWTWYPSWFPKNLICRVGDTMWFIEFDLSQMCVSSVWVGCYEYGKNAVRVIDDG